MHSGVRSFLSRRVAAAIPSAPPSRERRLKVLIVSQYFPPEIGATQARMQGFADYLAARGHEVTVISEFPNHPHGVIPDSYRGRLVEDDRSRSYRVLRVWVKASQEKTQRTRISFYLSYMAMATAVAPLVGRVDVVLATTPPLFTGIAGTAIAKMKRAPLVLDVRDLWPAAAVSLKQISNGMPLTLAEAIERYIYRAATVVSAVTRPFCEHVDAIRARPPATIFLPNGTVESFFTPEAPGDATAALEAPRDSFLLTFAGTHGIAQGLHSVLDAAVRAKEGLQISFVGDGPIKDALVARASDEHIANVSFAPAVPPGDLPPVLGSSDALLVTLSSHPLFATFIPSKLIDFMASGKPILLAAQGESAKLVRRAGAGIVVEPENPDALVRGARWLADHPRESAEMGRNGREFARSRLRVEQAARLEAVLFHLTRV